MFWYKQAAQRGLELLFYFYYGKLQEKGTVSDRFTAEQDENSRLRLSISAVERDDSAVYFCATSFDTALQSDLLVRQKPPSRLV